MSSNKNALIRYKILDRCFSNPGKRYFIKDLINECEKTLLGIDPNSNGISRKQIFEDIRFMESPEGWGIELIRHRDGKKVFYRYANPGFSINNMPLNEVEVNQLNEAIQILSQFRGMPQFDWVHELLPKLNQGMSSRVAADTIMEFDSNPYLKGIECLGTLHNAIFYKKVLQVEYQPYESETAVSLIIHPYFLKQYNNRWFLFGYNPEKDKYDWNMAIDRIVSLKEIKDKYHKNTLIKWQDYFEDIIGVTKPYNEKVQYIVLRFFGKTGNYIVTKPLHGSQKSKWINATTLEVKLCLIVNYEIERLLLSYGDSVQVIKPSFLAKAISQRLKNAFGLYDK